MSKIKDLANKIPKLNDLVVYNNGQNTKQLSTSTGAIVLQVLNDEELVTVYKGFMSAGSEAINHIHDGFEVFIIYIGEIEVTIDNTIKKVVTAPNCFYVEPKQIHSVKSNADSWIITVIANATEVL